MVHNFVLQSKHKNRWLEVGFSTANKKEAKELLKTAKEYNPKTIFRIKVEKY